MFAEFEALALIIGCNLLAVELGGLLGHDLVDQPPDALAMFEHKGRLVAADLEHTLGALAACAPAKAGIKEARVVDAKFADHGDIGGHFGGMCGRDGDGFATDQDIKCAGVEDDPAVGAVDLFPEIGGGVVGEFAQINHACVRFGAVADEGAGCGAQVDGKAEAVGDNRGHVDDGAVCVQGGEGRVGDECGARAEDDLVEHLACGGDDRKALRADFDVERAGIAIGDAIKFGAVVGDDAGKQIEAADGGFGGCSAAQARGQGEGFLERDDVDAALFEDGAACQINLVHAEIGEAVCDGAARSGKEGGADAVCGGAKAQIKGGGLNLTLGDGGLGCDRAGGDEVFDLEIGKNAGVGHVRPLGSAGAARP